MDKFFITTANFPIGELTLCSDKTALVGVWFENQKYFGADLLKDAIQNDSLEIFKDTKLWLKDYFRGVKVQPKDLPLAPIGNKFRQAVWQELCKIPYGETTTYGAIAKEIASQRGLSRMSAQAIGGAIGHNPISIIIPCHRVVGKKGNLTGYAGGIDIKKMLLEIESCNN